MSNPKRRELIAEIRAGIANGCAAHMDAERCNQLIDDWRDDVPATTPFHHGVYAMCDDLARQLDERRGDDA